MEHSSERYDWSQFTPSERAVLTFVRNNGSVLLIRKLRGLGQGKINAPGGRIEHGESAAEAAIRETHEEVGLRVERLQWMAGLEFAFVDGYTLCVDVFVTQTFSGSPIETEEAIPLWFNEEAIPYEQMWEDDRHWLPHVLAGRRLRARCVFDGDTMIEKELSFQE